MNNVVKFIDYSKRKVNYRQQLQLQLLYRRDAEDAEDFWSGVSTPRSEPERMPLEKPLGMLRSR
jgi:hypothetical protein